MSLSNTKETHFHIHIKPKKGLQVIDFQELRRYQDLFYFFVFRDIKIKYKQTVLGGLWAIIQPFFSMVVFTLFFGKLAKMPSDGIPYPIFNFSAMVTWTYFATTVSSSSNSLIGGANLISKVYFPRLIIPLTPAVAGLLDYFIASVVLIGMMFYYGMMPTILILLVPLLILLMMTTACGVGLFLSALSAKYRDIRFTVPFLIQIWMFASPIVYPSSMIPEKYQLLYALNPMVGIIEGFRSVLLGTIPFPTQKIIISAIVSFIIFNGGLYFFKQTERYFADII